MTDPREKRQFGRRNTNSITISSNGKTREYRVPAALFLTLGAVFTMFMVGYIAATTYLAFRDDLMAAAIKRNIEMQRAYEDRIAALRSKVDRITSRQLLDQQAVEAKVAELMKQQQMLSGQSGALNGLFERAKQNGLDPSGAGDRADAAIDFTTTGSVNLAGTSSFLRGSAIGQQSGDKIAIGNVVDVAELTPGSGLFTGVLDQINSIAESQRTALVALSAEAHAKANKLASVYETLNVPMPGDVQSAVGGPFVPDNAVEFADLADELNASLDTLETLKQKVQRLPIGNPVPGAAVSSHFGSRVDPFNRKKAFHAGIDFRGRTGTPVLSSGSGKVISAGRRGGYGLMVEIDHGQGLTTRYAHLSKILVKPGTHVAKGQRIGKIGSTGRSTGPHLHYEIRTAKKANNPARFLKAGRNVEGML